ncbi:Hypothetical protein PACV_376 [Pacmanvirus A23]|uniref:Hypothetical protein n=1 Tax=Pacmanvirus A23 TaxID=1932881 RepID=UPI000A0955F1|nr:Hypothetical protein B9W72_gp372 [Pacmanvirus A23]SIP86089.1 Hypothetical protein PACV_376 [Pacmanvirus A23]
MADSIEVKPRFKDPDILQHEVQQNNAVNEEQSNKIEAAVSVTKGIFTSMYENKVIVIIVIIVIITIAIIVYVIFRKTDDETEKPKPTPTQIQNTAPNVAGDTQQTQSTQSTQPTQSTQQQTEQTQPTQQQTQSTQQPEQTQQSQQNEKNKLMNLLARSKKQEEKPANSKSDDEIMQMMEDTPVAEVVESVETEEVQQPTAEPSDNISQDETESVNFVDSLNMDDTTTNDSEQRELIYTLDDTPQDENEQSSGNQNGLCSTLVPSGRQCRNKAKTNGKCQLHSR